MGRLRQRWDLHDDSGRVSLLVLGFLAILLMLVFVAIDVTAVQLARIRVLDAADAAAADAADAIDERAVYDGSLNTRVRLTDKGIGYVAGRNLAEQNRPQNVVQWNVAGGTGTPDGSTAVVRITATIRPPVGRPALPFSRDVTVTVESRARAEIQR